jgi:hypothetical protein
MEQKQHNLLSHLLEVISETYDTQKAINDLENVNRKRMCETIVTILKEKGGKLTADDWENVLDENLEITFISEDGTYINNYCKVNSIELFEMHDGTPNFTIACENSNDLPEYALSYDNVYQIFETLSSCWYFTQR